MRLVSWTWFWYVLLGFILGGGSVYLWMTLKEKAIKMVWYEWVLSVLSIVIILFMGQTFIGSFEEGEPQAAWLSLVFMGIPIIILAVILVRSMRSRMAKA